MSEQIEILYEIADAIGKQGVKASIDSDHNSAELIIEGPSGKSYVISTKDMKEVE